MILALDHVTLVVRDLDETVASYEAILGRAADWRGTLPGARHAWFQLPNVGLDIVSGYGDGREAALADIDKHGEGLWGMGFAVADLDEAVRLLTRRGIEFLPSHVTRSTDSDGAVREWRLAVMRRKSANGLGEFLVERGHGAPAWPASPATAQGAVSGLDHVVVNTANADRALAHFGARLGLDLRLDRSNPQWNSRLLFFRCGDLVVEIGARFGAAISDASDKFGGLAWRVADAAAVQARLQAKGFDVSVLRKGRKPGTHVFTVRNRNGSVPTLMIEASGDD